MSNIVIGTTADEGYLYYLAPFVRSMVHLARGGEQIELHILGDRVRNRHQRRIRQAWKGEPLEVHWHDVSLDELRSSHGDGGLQVTAHFLRVLLPEERFAGGDRLIYLDCDTLAMGSLRPLWELDMGGNIIGAFPQGLPDAESFPDAAAIGWQPGWNYCNTGVLLIDCARWRDERLGWKLLDLYAGEHRHTAIPDQTILNLLTIGRTSLLEPRWNHFAGNPERTQAHIVHFLGWDKPWSDRCQPQFRQAFYDLLDETPYSRWKTHGDYRQSLVPLPRRWRMRLRHSRAGEMWRAVKARIGR